MNNYKENDSKDFIYTSLNKIRQTIELCKEIVIKFKCIKCNKKIKNDNNNNNQIGGNIIDHILLSHDKSLKKIYNNQIGGKYNKNLNIDDPDFEKKIMINIKIMFSNYENSLMWNQVALI